MPTMYTLKEISNATGAKPAFVQNAVARGIFQLQNASTLGKQIKRRYTLQDACSIGYMVEMNRLKVPPAVAARYLDDVLGVVSKLALGETILRHWSLPDKMPQQNERTGLQDLVDVIWQPKDSNVFIFYPTDKDGQWERVPACMSDGEVYTSEGPDIQKQIELTQKYQNCPIEECEDDEMREYKDYLIKKSTFDEDSYQELVRNHAKTNDPEFDKSNEIRKKPFDLTALPDCFIVLQVDRLIRKIFRELKVFD